MTSEGDGGTAQPPTEPARISAVDLHRFMAQCLTAVGVSAPDAAVVADVLVAADLGGIDSHGAARLARYVDGIRRGSIASANLTRVVQRSMSTAVLDVGNGLGQPAAMAATRLATELAEDAGLGAVVLRRSNHFGIAGYYARAGARAGMLTIVATNATPQVAPTHGVEKLLGTNPIAVGMPTDPEEPFVFDGSTSVAPRGRLERRARGLGTAEAPVGWAIDGNGAPATHLAEILTGLRQPGQHALLPLGGTSEDHGSHKGFGLGLIVDMLCGPLAGALWGRHVYGPAGAGIGQFILCLNVDHMVPIATFRAACAAMLDEIRKSRPADPGWPVRVAGDGERATRMRRLQEGIPLPPDVAASLLRMAASLDVTVPALQPARDHGKGHLPCCRDDSRV